MPLRPLSRFWLGCFLLASPCVVLGTPAAMAQSSSDADRDAAEAAQKAQAKADAKAAAPPPAIPGAVTDEATATSGHASADMEPTAALFDAINRGDIVSAKEALGRGADLNGRNVLGQNPLDMAIDLNRSDITFLLLSMR
ncbi:MAG: ankyrin repeat domain-containing protein, partial [Gluconacetobacter diazotrophicus]|nr:ankyrin repeat domain-containing protein [Gluconacetobacter diazotrophicus]